MPRLPGIRTMAAAVLPLVVAAVASTATAKDVPFVPTPMPIVQQMLEMAGAGPDDIVYDLGSGDGRIVIAAVRDFGVRRATGIDIDSERIAEGRKNAREAGIGDRARFIEGSFFEEDFSDATILTMYLLSGVNLKLRPRILSELRPGTRVVSHQFDMGDWEPDRETVVDGHRVYLWTVPARVAGTWRWSVDGQEFSADMEQSYQRISGQLRAGDAEGAKIRNAELAGDRLRFRAEPQLNGRTVPLDIDGRIAGDAIEGTVEIDGERRPLRAERMD